MVKARVTTKAKEHKVMIDLDADVVDALEDIAKLADITPSQVVNVLLSVRIYNDKKYQEDKLKTKTRTKKVSIGLGDK